ncbi:MAG: bifunctional tetrahydrofolate synthase/dihydrofolate synthase, partial [Gammaproteobacteria bacterium]
MTTSAALASIDRLAPRFGSLKEWLFWQERLHFPAIELGLERSRTVAERLGLLPPGFTVLTIAGTNGKGSSAAMLDLALRGAGYRVGKYTSPHLMRYNERICVDGAEMTDDELCRVFDQVDGAREDVSLTYFEFGTLAALQVFREMHVDVAIMEVGLGGRLDAVNILDADVALVTTIDLDHERWLGSDRESIGREKAGIFRAGRPAVCADPHPPNSVIQAAQAVGATYYQAGRDFIYSVSGGRWDWRIAGGRALLAMPNPCTDHKRQVQNAAGVLMVLSVIADRFPVSAEVICASLGDFHLAGRFQIVPGQIPFVLDVAHNRQAAEVLAENLVRLPCTGRTHLVIGMLKDKNHRAFAEALSG